MSWMNEYEIDDALELFAGHPVLGPATRTLSNLRDWTNRNSDGWPYWTKPARAADALMTLIDGARVHVSYWDTHDDEPELRAAYAAALRPIKAFRTRQGADFLTAEEEDEAQRAEALERERCEDLGIPTSGY